MSLDKLRCKISNRGGTMTFKPILCMEEARCTKSLRVPSKSDAAGLNYALNPTHNRKSTSATKVSPKPPKDYKLSIVICFCFFVTEVNGSSITHTWYGFDCF